jgi:hypothetical protein
MECTVKYIINKKEHPLAAEINIIENKFIKKTSEILPITELLSCHKNIKISEFRNNSLFLYSESFLPPYTELITEFYTNFLFFYFKLNIH